MMSFTVDDTLVAGVGVQVENLVAHIAPEAGLAPPGLLSHNPLHKIGFLAADLAYFVNFNCRWFRYNLRVRET